jgi:hypothetical protein
MVKIQWNKVTWYSKLAAVIVFILVFFLGIYIGAEYNETIHIAGIDSQDGLLANTWRGWHRHSLRLAPIAEATTTPKLPTKPAKNKPIITTPTSTQPTSTTPTSTPVPVPSNPNEKRFSAYLTAYTYWDNTPPGSADISNPIIHQKAGGTGTFSDPITLAVGHSYATGKDVLDYQAGTKFYIPYLKKYFIVEDTCGDGNHPENGPCHSGYQGNPWLDMWIDGANGTRSVTNTCAEDITEIHTVIQNPASNYAVVVGPVFNGSCATQFSDTPVSAI